MAGDAVKPKAVVLLSGGLDSATVGAIAREQGFEIHALSFAYGQRHAVELAAATRVADAIGVEQHLVQSIDMRIYGGSALTDNVAVPVGRDEATMSSEIPVTYVPARNTIFLAHALGYAEVVGAFDLFIGANAVDYSGYPDCRPEFVEQFERLANVATASAVEGRGTFRVHAPLMAMTKAEIIKEGVRLGVNYSMTHSCYDPSEDGLACGGCDSCVLRAKGFVAAGVDDPTRYVDGVS